MTVLISRNSDMKKKYIILLCACLVIGLLIFGLSQKPKTVPDTEPEETVTPPEPEPEPEPEKGPWDDYALNKLTGEYNLDKEMGGFRPVAIVINNITLSLPQRGINNCDVLLEIEVEGGITRTMAFYADYRKITEAGSVRSLRNQFLDLARPIDAMIIHVGSSAFATDSLNSYGYKTLDAMGCSIVKQDKSRLSKYGSEHTWFTNAELIESCISTLKMRTEDNSPEPVFHFADYGTDAVVDDGDATEASWAFSDDYDSKIKYDESTGTYTLSQHGKARTDELDGEQFSFSNVFVLVASRPDYYGAGVPRYDFSAGGTGYYLSRGKYEAFSWTKDSASSRMVFTDSNGKELTVNPGRSYIAIVNTKHADSISLTGNS